MTWQDYITIFSFIVALASLGAMIIIAVKQWKQVKNGNEQTAGINKQTEEIQLQTQKIVELEQKILDSTKMQHAAYEQSKLKKHKRNRREGY